MMTIIIILIRYGVVYQNLLFFPSIIPNSKQIIKIKKHTLENSYNAPGKNAYISIINNKASRDCLNSVSRGFIHKLILNIKID